LPVRVAGGDITFEHTLLEYLLAEWVTQLGIR